MTNIEKLLIRRAELTKLIKENKADSANGVCLVQWPGADTGGWLYSPKVDKNCIERAYHKTKEISTPYDQFSFDEVFHDLLGEDGEPACEHCRKVIRNKRARALLGKKIAGVNSALTRIGKKLLKEHSND